MTAKIYYARAADQLAEAQRTLDTHVTSSQHGRCIACGAPGPCPRRETAVVMFSRTLRLPTRLPGATRPDCIGTPWAGGSWFDKANDHAPAPAVSSDRVSPGRHR